MEAPQAPDAQRHTPDAKGHTFCDPTHRGSLEAPGPQRQEGQGWGGRELGISGDSVHLGRRDLLEADGAMAAPQGECTYGHRIVPVKMDKRSRRRYVYFSRIRSKGVRGDLGAQAAPGPCGVWKELPARGTLGILTTGRLTDWG